MAAAPPATIASKVNWPVFIVSAAIIVAFTLWAAAAPGSAYEVLEGAFTRISGWLGWYFILTAAIVVGFVLIVAFSRSGRVKLGPDHSKPRFNLFTWTAMLFAAGIGVDLMFFAVVGPATNLRVGPGAAEGTLQAAEEAALWTMFHYGIPGWAMYALMGMAFGLFAYRYHLPLSIRSALLPIIGRRARGATGDVIETAAVIGTVFGIATSLGIGVVFLSFGIGWVFDIEAGTGVQVALVVLAAVVVTFSTVSGVDKGIRRLSELNVVVAILLMIYVLVSGETVQLLNALVKNFGDFIALFPGMLTETFAYDTSEAWLDEGWVEWWTVFFWAWWMAWAPFVGLFLARISRGRTLRQFIIGVLVVPFAFIAIWISIFGNATVSRIMGGDTEFAEQAEDFEGSGYFALMAEFPGASFIIGVSVLVGLLFYVTSADSGALVLANFTSKTRDTTSDGPPWLRVVWSFIIGGLTLVMLLLDGIYTLQMATVIVGLPLSIILYLLMAGVWRALRLENYAADSRQSTLSSALSERIVASGEGARGQWRRRLARHMQYPTAAEVTTYMNTVAAPAIEEVAAELESQGAQVRCSRGTVPGTDIPHMDLHVFFGDQPEFKYQAYPIAHSVPSFAPRLRTQDEVCYQVEIFSATGSLGHDIFGYTQEQIITDVIDSYQRHLAVLTMNEEAGRPVTMELGQVPDEWDHDRTSRTTEGDS
ncbi:choline BCCT transporter BetT [Nesterenkonia natronophila]|uniref:BCCT family transporter n=1 Tax=Nesterenkonia natronophila TaxID=2174932 RepID=A0A3A4FBI7_9MICC|nr:choline BCCT transporter BetT [Nesterenkonia natronophila]RJN32164.1 BCCT family transporter [Nesterenkonia natronophila]